MENENQTPETQKKTDPMVRHRRLLLILLAAFMAMALGLTLLIRAENQFTMTVDLKGEPEIFLEYGTPYRDEGVTVTLTGTTIWKDGKQRDVPVVVEGKVNSDRVGKYVLTYTAQDQGITGSVQRSVWVVDVTPPEIRLLHGADDPEPGKRYEEEGYQATDDYDGDITDRVIRAEEMGKIIYSVADSSGNFTSVEREVPVYDEVPPVINLEGGGEFRIPVGTEFVEPGYIALDAYAGDLTDQVTVEGEVDSGTPGLYTLTYSVKDGFGNVGQVTRSVIVEGMERPQVVIPDGKTIYLTFDDGPGPYTDELLDVLARYGVKATFFVVGRGHKAQMQRIVEEGHSIGVHSITHDYKQIYASHEAYFGDILGMQQIIYDNTGVKTTLMRFPGGSSNMVSRFNKGIMTYLTEAVQDAGFQYFDWNVDSNDAGGARTSDEVFENVTEGIRNHRTSVVLQHDIHHFSVQAVERIIRWGLDNGYTFRPLEPTSYGAHHGINN